MDAKDLIRAGRLSDARSRLIEDVKSSPADMDKRTLLFQVHCFCGEWEKAERQLDIIVTQDASRETGVQVYKNLIHAEKERTEIFRNRLRPSFLPETPPYAEMYYAAVEKLAEKKIDEAKDLFDKVDAQMPLISGIIDGKDFTGFRDTDTLLSLFLETIIHDRYVCIPFEALRELSISSPRTLFDLIWAQAHITTWEGLTLNCYLPVLYTESCLHEDDRVRLGRMTDWISLGGPFIKGSGQHVYKIGEEEIPLLEIREVSFKTPRSGES
jgi:type VI secretion system protein ImpE